MRRSKRRPIVKYSLVGVILALGVAAIGYNVTHKKKTLATAQPKAAKKAPASSKSKARGPKPIPAMPSDTPVPVRSLRPSDTMAASVGTSDSNALSHPASEKNSVVAASAPPEPADYASVYSSRYGTPGTALPADPTDSATAAGTSASKPGTSPAASSSSLADRMAAAGVGAPLPPPPGAMSSSSSSAAPSIGATATTSDPVLPTPPGDTNAGVTAPSSDVEASGANSTSAYQMPGPPPSVATSDTAGSLPTASNSSLAGSSNPTTPPADPTSSRSATGHNGAALAAGAAAIYGASRAVAAPRSVGAAAAGTVAGATVRAVGDPTPDKIDVPPTSPPTDVSTAQAALGLPNNPPAGNLNGSDANLEIPASPGTDSSMSVSDTPPLSLPAPPPFPNANNAAVSSPSGSPATSLGAKSAISSTGTPVSLGSTRAPMSSPTPVPSPAAAASVAGSAPSDVPGEHRFEGLQTPTLTIEKSAPEEVQVDRKAVFHIQVHNIGSVPADNVIVVDRVPRGTEFVRATPAVTPTAEGLLVWQLGTITPGQSTSLDVELLPKVEGEIGSVAQVTFQAKASVRSICTRPKLTVQLSTPEKVLIGQKATVQITVTNTGTGAATNVVLEEDVPTGFTHPAGRALEHAIGTLAPGASVQLALELNAVKPGVFENKLLVRGDGNLLDQKQQRIEVTAPQLQVTAGGPRHRFLDRQATYVIQVANPGTAAARNIQLVNYLPKGMKYVTSNHQGQYDPQTHAVYWSLTELPAGEKGQMQVTVLPLEAGDLKLRIDAKADLGLSKSVEKQVQVEGTPELVFTVKDAADPIEIGKQTSYEITVRNIGSKGDSNVQLVAQLPPGLEPTSGSGPTQATVQGQIVSFAPLTQLGPDEQAVFTIHARGITAGFQVARFQLRSNELQVPVTKEEGTRVYADQ